MRWLPYVALLAVACFRVQTSPEASAYLEAALDSLEVVALTRASVDWPSVRRETRELARGATSTVQTYPAIRHALTRLADDHSFLQLSDSLAALEALARAGGDAEDVQPPPTSPSPFGTRMEPELELVERDWGVVGFVFMPQGRRSDTFAASFQAGLAELATARPCGWVVDLRGNGGGNMWPMLAGLGPLLGDGVVGGSIDADGARSAWIYRDGAAIYRDTSGGEQAFARVTEPLRLEGATTPIAVLHDRGTASSGEAMAIAFRGHPETRSFGERTYGASTSTRGVRLADGANMVVATDVFVDRNGTAYRAGVEPDEVVPPPDTVPPLESDTTVARALEWLSRTRACRG